MIQSLHSSTTIIWREVLWSTWRPSSASWQILMRTLCSWRWNSMAQCIFYTVSTMVQRKKNLLLLCWRHILIALLPRLSLITERRGEQHERWRRRKTLGFIGWSVVNRSSIQYWGRRSAVLLVFGLVVCCFAAARDGLDKTIQHAIDGSCAPGLFPLISLPTIVGCVGALLIIVAAIATPIAKTQEQRSAVEITFTEKGK